MNALEKLLKSNILAANRLQNDPRIEQAKQLVLSAVQDHQQQITGIRSANPELKLDYQQVIDFYNQARGGKLWYPYLGSGIGNGALVELLDGSVKYDFISGIGVHYWGHSHHALIEASIDAALSDTIMQGHLQQNADSIELTEILLLASGLDHCFLSSSGAMANENALKIAFQKNYPAYRVLAFERCFVGRTLAVSQITDKPAFREGLPHTLSVDYIPYFDSTDPEGSTHRAVETLKKFITRYPKQHAAMVMEFVQGEGGFYHGTENFFKLLIAILKENGIAVIADEVQTFGRLPYLFAFQHFGLTHEIDIVTIGKLSQVCATLFRKSYLPKPGLLSQTFTAATAAIRAGKIIIQSLMHDGYLGSEGKISQIQNYFHEKLEEIAKRHPNLLKGPFGIGCMVAFTPLNGEQKTVQEFMQKLFDAGVIGFVAGSNPTRARFLVPAGAITHKDIDHVCKIIEDTLQS